MSDRPRAARMGQPEGEGRSILSGGVSGWEGVPSSFVRVEMSRVGPYLCSQKGRALLTAGTTAKLYSGGGELIVHSSVAASHGSPGARWPVRTLRIALTKNTSTERVITKAPTVATRFHRSHPRSAA